MDRCRFGGGRAQAHCTSGSSDIVSPLWGGMMGKSKNHTEIHREAILSETLRRQHDLAVILSPLLQKERWPSRSSVIYRILTGFVILQIRHKICSHVILQCCVPKGIKPVLKSSGCVSPEGQSDSVHLEPPDNALLQIKILV